MRRRIIPTLILVAAALTVLSACNIVIDGGGTPWPPTTKGTLNVSDTKSGSPDRTVTLSDGEDVYFEIDVNSHPDPLVYVELDHSLDLTLFNASNRALVSSSGNQYFAAGTAAVQATAVAPEGISVVPARCDGSCVAREIDTGTYYAHIVNHSGGTVNVGIWVYDGKFADSGDTPGASNDTLSGAVSVGSGSSGALETVGDVDYWSVGQAGTMKFASRVGNQLNMVLRVVDDGGNVLEGPFAPGDTFPVYAGDFLRVESLASRAAKGDFSVYDLTYVP